MASISTDAKGNRRIMFKDDSGERRSVRLGKMPLRATETVKLRIEAIVAAKIAGMSMDSATAEWVRDLPPKLYDKIAAVGVLPNRTHPGKAVLGAFIDGYIASRTDTTARTAVTYQNVRRNLVAYFGEHKPLGEITAGDADEFRRYLGRPKVPGHNVGQGLGENTVRRRCGIAKQILRAAARKRLITENPFADQRDLNVQGNQAREFNVSRDTAEAVIAACPDAQWRLLFALSRYGGLRCPSEHLSLTWADIDWERARMRVTSPKTARYSGKGERWVPLFPELLPHLEQVFHEADAGTTHVITRYRDNSSNLRTHLNRIIIRAGLTPWPKLFQNLRATRQTELAESYPMHVVCAWIGNSEAVARDHYLQVTETHFEKAAQKQAQQAPVSVGNDGKPNVSADKNTRQFSPLPTDAFEKVGPPGLEPGTKGL